jgi:hypothetical protein
VTVEWDVEVRNLGLEPQSSKDNKLGIIIKIKCTISMRKNKTLKTDHMKFIAWKRSLKVTALCSDY